MALTLNERYSPDIRSFQATLKDVLGTYVCNHNSDNEQSEFMPHAKVNVVNIPLADDIDKIMEDVVKIDYVKWKFFPLNGDKCFNALYEGANQVRKGVDSDNADFVCKSPKSTVGVTKIIKETMLAGQAHTELKVWNKKSPKA